MIHFKYWENILISRLYEQLSRNGSSMAPERLFEKISNFKKNEHVIYYLKARGLEISNIQLLSRNIQISRKYEPNRFREIS